MSAPTDVTVATYLRALTESTVRPLLPVVGVQPVTNRLENPPPANQNTSHFQTPAPFHIDIGVAARFAAQLAAHWRSNAVVAPTDAATSVETLRLSLEVALPATLSESKEAREVLQLAVKIAHKEGAQPGSLADAAYTQVNTVAQAHIDVHAWSQEEMQGEQTAVMATAILQVRLPTLGDVVVTLALNGADTDVAFAAQQDTTKLLQEQQHHLRKSMAAWGLALNEASFIPFVQEVHK